jgi:hypothetical protein
VNDIFVFDGQQFNQVPGKLISMAVSGTGTQWGINASFEVFRRAYPDDALGFRQVPGQLRQIVVDEEAFAWGLN